MSDLIKNPVNLDFVKSFIECTDPDRPSKDKINITPELAEHLDGRCFLDLDMHERLEAFQFHKSPYGITMEYCGADGGSVAYVDVVDKVDKFGGHIIDNTYCGCTIYEVVFNKAENIEIPAAAYEHIKRFAQQQIAIRKANREYIAEVRDIIIKNAIKK